jgi:hypothetical protein
MFLKDPDSVLDYSVDWTAAAAGAGAIVDSRWTVSPAEAGGAVVLMAGLTGMRATVRLAGGKAGHVYRIANRVQLADGSSDERSLVVRVEER